jgi:RimJ/RimL family protein N-acetyltransferase
MDCDGILQRIDRPRELETLLGVQVGEFAKMIGDVAAQTTALYERLPRDPSWIGYVTADRVTNQVIGVCGFKNAPANGAVEVAYFTFPAFENRGFATAMAAEMVAIARSSPDIRAVIAHTLPQPNASTRVLYKNGFRNAGEIIDPEDGPVWRWELDLFVRTV